MSDFTKTYGAFPSTEGMPAELRVGRINDYQPIVENVAICTTDIHILNSKNQLLVTMRNNPPIKGREWVQGGRQNKGETARQSAVRYLQKELGIVLGNPNRLKFMNMTDEFFPDSEFTNEKGIVPRHTRCANFVIKMRDDELTNIKLDEQHSNYRWAELNDETLHPYLKEDRIPFIKSRLLAQEALTNDRLFDTLFASGELKHMLDKLMSATK